MRRGSFTRKGGYGIDVAYREYDLVFVKGYANGHLNIYVSYSLPFIYVFVEGSLIMETGGLPVGHLVVGRLLNPPFLSTTSLSA
jgi:hypothetical protein